MTIFQMIKADHKGISAHLARLQKTFRDEPTLRKKLFTLFKRDMLAHAKAEEHAVYLALQEKEKTRALIFEGFEEHHLVDHLITQLDSLDPSLETWTAKMTVLKVMIEHHVEDEESDLFKKMKSVCDATELTQMAEAMRTYKNTPHAATVPRERSTEDVAA